MRSQLMIAALAAATIASGFAHNANAAPSYSFTVQEANTPGGGFPAAPGGLTGGITATFTYTGALNFSNTASQNASNSGDLNSAFFGTGTVSQSATGTATANGSISGYSGSGSLANPAGANFSTLANFLASSGSDANYQYGSLYTIALNTLSAGTVLTITHDDGVSVYQNGAQVGTTTSGPTQAVTDTVTLTSTAATTLYYARENGTPSVLIVSVPEPGSVALFGVGLLGLAYLGCRRPSKGSATA